MRACADLISAELSATNLSIMDEDKKDDVVKEGEGEGEEKVVEPTEAAPEAPAEETPAAE